MKCTVCGTLASVKALYCSNACRQKAYRNRQGICDENSVEILEVEQERQFVFVTAAALIQQYPSCAPEFIEKLVEACVQTEFPIEQAAQRYCGRDYSVPVSSTLVEYYTELHRVARQISQL